MSDVINLNEGAEIVRLRKELREWRRRNDLAYEFNWDIRAREMIAYEIISLKRHLRDLTGSPA
jgi:hypothetical protein